MRRYFLVISVMSFTAAGCGGERAEPDSAFLAIDAPAEVGDAHDVSEEPGIQVDLGVVSELAPGTELSLAVTSAAGARSDWPEAARVDGAGEAVFEAISLPPGSVELSVSCGESCGYATAAATVSVIGGFGCELFLGEEPLESDHYAPYRVLNRALDADPSAPDFQAQVHVVTEPGYTAELFLIDVETGARRSLGERAADRYGLARFEADLEEGRRGLRADCVSPGGSTRLSAGSRLLHVDVTAPDCFLDTLADGEILDPELDADEEIRNGTQRPLRGVAASPDRDVAGEPTEFTIGDRLVKGPALSEEGSAQVIGDFVLPGERVVEFTTTDHAGNRCIAARKVGYEVPRCRIRHYAPTGTVWEDWNVREPGVQARFAVEIDPACAGLTAVATCDAGVVAEAQVREDGFTSFELTLCAEGPCVGAFACEATVTSALGVTSSEQSTILIAAE